MLHSFKALLLLLFFCIFVIAEVENSAATDELTGANIINVNGITNTDASVNVDTASEVDASADVDEQGGPRGGSAPPARAPPAQHPQSVQQRPPPTQPHNVQAQPTRQPTHVQPQPTQPHNVGGGGSPFGGNGNGNSRPPVQSRPPTVVPGGGQTPWNGNGNGGNRPPTTIQSRPPTVVPGQGQWPGNSRPPTNVGATSAYGWPGNSRSPTNVGATSVYGWPGSSRSPTNIGATSGYGWPGGSRTSTNVGATAGPGWPYGNRPPPATVTVRDPPPYGYNPGGYPPAYTSTRYIPYPTPGGGYGYNDPYGYPVNINLPPVNLPPIIIDNPIWTIPLPGCSYVAVTTQSPTAIETGFTSTITQFPDSVTVYIGDDGYQTTYGNDPQTAYEVYMYTTTVYVDVVSKTRDCWL